MREYHIIGNPGMSDETTLETIQGERNAIDWATRYCRRDLGGYDSIVVCFFGSDGEAVDVWRKESGE